MGRGQLCLLFLVLCMILISLGLTLTSIVTDYWYTVKSDNSNVTVANTFSYSFGMWRKCYSKEVPTGMYQHVLCQFITLPIKDLYWVSF